MEEVIHNRSGFLFGFFRFLFYQIKSHTHIQVIIYSCQQHGRCDDERQEQRDECKSYKTICAFFEYQDEVDVGCKISNNVNFLRVKIQKVKECEEYYVFGFYKLN